ncbi:MAG: TAXI family TRAP transporter solute-binding subunit [Synergistaceae bacterium]|nr:TAXI family TRAP transporter solute-binding subunit [Synergistaceae bacterium]
MKKAIVAAIVVIALLFAAGPMTSVAEAKTYRINIATATTGGAYYPIGNAMAQIWSKNIKDVQRASAQSTAGTPQNVELMQDEEVQVAIGQTGICYYAYTGTGTYEGQTPYKEMRGMFTLYPNVMHWVAGSESGIKSIADFKGKRFVPGQVASATEVNSREMMEPYGLNYMKDKGETNVTADYLGYNEAVDLMKNGQTDGAHIAGGVPTAAVLDTISSGAGYLISIEEDKMKEISEKYPWYFHYTIPAGAYSSKGEDIETLAVANILFTDVRQDEELIYQLTKATFEYHDDLVAAHKATEYTVLENSLNGMPIPLHKGAVRYLKEMGVEVPEKLIVD